MSPYLAIFRIRARALLQYRAAAFAGVCTQLFWGFIYTMILTAFYQSASTSEPLTLSQAHHFIWIIQAFIPLLPWFLDKEIEAQIKSGAIAYELARPLSLYGVWLARAAALRSIPFLMRALPIFLVAALVFDLPAPVSLPAFLISALLAIFLSAAITALIIATFFWTLTGEGVKRLFPPLLLLLSGVVVPLPLFPSFLQPFLAWQPFRGFVDIPCRLYLGLIPASEAYFYWGFQLGWAALFLAAGHLLLKKALNRFVIQGG